MSDAPNIAAPAKDDAKATPGADAKPGKKSKNDKTGKTAKKGEKDKKGEKGKKGAAGSVAGHPRAAAAVRRAKGLGGLAGFALAALLAHRAGLSVTGMLERALLGGAGGYLIAWACAVTVWRQILLAQMRSIAAQRHASAPPARRTLSMGAAVDGAGEEPAAETAVLPAAPTMPGR